MNKPMPEWVQGFGDLVELWFADSIASIRLKELCCYDQIVRRKSKRVKQNEFSVFRVEFLSLSEYTEKVSILEICECMTHCHTGRVENSVME